MTTETPPVQDWATDYDIFDPGYIADPYGIWDELRSACPIAHTERWGGSWLPTRYADVTEIARDIERFPSGNGISVVPIVDVGPGSNASPLLSSGVPPISADPPLHTWTRRLVAADDEPSAGRRVRGLHPRVVSSTRGCDCRTRHGRRCRRVRTADSSARDRSHSRGARIDVCHVHGVGPRRTRVRERRRASPARCCLHRHLSAGCHRRTAGQPAGRLHQRAPPSRARWRADRPAGGDGHVRPACSSPVWIPRGRRSARRCGTSQRTPTIAADWWPNPS